MTANTVLTCNHNHHFKNNRSQSSFLSSQNYPLPSPISNHLTTIHHFITAITHRRSTKASFTNSIHHQHTTRPCILSTSSAFCNHKPMLSHHLKLTNSPLQLIISPPSQSNPWQPSSLITASLITVLNYISKSPPALLLQTQATSCREEIKK